MNYFVASYIYVYSTIYMFMKDISYLNDLDHDPNMALHDLKQLFVVT